MPERHDLHHEFPEMHDIIHVLKTENAHFRRLFDEYGDVVRELHGVSEGAGIISDERAESLKRQRLALKDQLFSIMNQKSDCACAGTCSG